MAELQTNIASQTCADGSFQTGIIRMVYPSRHAPYPHNGCVQTGLENPKLAINQFPKQKGSHDLRPRLVRGMTLWRRVCPHQGSIHSLGIKRSRVRVPPSHWGVAQG